MLFTVQEVSTLAGSFPVREVAAATAVSTSTTAVAVALVCCCCPPCRRKDNSRLDVNDNEKKSGRNKTKTDQGKDNKDKIFHERYSGYTTNDKNDKCGNKFWRKCLEQSSERSSSEYHCQHDHDKEDMELGQMYTTDRSV